MEPFVNIPLVVHEDLQKKKIQHNHPNILIVVLEVTNSTIKLKQEYLKNYLLKRIFFSLQKAKPLV